MVLSVALRLRQQFLDMLSEKAMQTYSFTELMINFQGGLVRRGLLGEVLLWLTSTTGISPHLTIATLCLIAYALVTWFFFKKFKAGGYNWWLILSPLMCGFVVAIIRKDFMLYGVVICVFCLMRNADPAPWKRTLAFLLAVFGLMLHEAFFFWGIPIFALILISDRKHLFVNSLQLLILLAIFGVLCHFKGDMHTANAILDSWNAVIDGSPLQFEQRNSIGALTWDTKETMIHHFKLNGYTNFGLVYWPLCAIVIYYFISFFFTAFKPSKAKYGTADQTRLSAMMLTLLICLLPMFTVLSCDFGRLYQYTIITSIAAYLILDKSVIDRMLPAWFQRFVSSLNRAMSTILPPSKGLIAILLLIIGISPYWFNPTASMIASPVGTIGFYAIIFIHKLAPLIL